MAERDMDKELAMMDEAAQQAQAEMEKLDPASVKEVGEWWLRWYLKAGHKRLGRILIARTKEIARELEE